MSAPTGAETIVAAADSRQTAMVGASASEGDSRRRLHLRCRAISRRKIEAQRALRRRARKQRAKRFSLLQTTAIIVKKAKAANRARRICIFEFECGEIGSSIFSARSLFATFAAYAARGAQRCRKRRATRLIANKRQLCALLIALADEWRRLFARLYARSITKNVDRRALNSDEKRAQAADLHSEKNAPLYDALAVLTVHQNKRRCFPAHVHVVFTIKNQENGARAQQPIVSLRARVRVSKNKRGARAQSLAIARRIIVKKRTPPLASFDLLIVAQAFSFAIKSLARLLQTTIGVCNI